LVLAMDLDPDPLRTRMRQAVAARDLAVMRELTAKERLSELEPGSIFVLSAELWGGGEEANQPEVFGILEHGRRLYPGDFVLQAVLGFFYQSAARFEPALDCRRIAAGLRPGDLNARVAVGESQVFAGLPADAAATLQTCVTLDPANAKASYFLGAAQTLLGDHAGALASFSRHPEIATNPAWKADLHVAQFYNGLLSREEIERRIGKEVLPNSVATYLCGLVDHPDPEQRNPELVVRVIEERRSSLSIYRWTYVLEAIARVRLEDWDGAQAAIEHRYELPYIMLMTPMAYDFLRSRIHSGLGRTAEARASYERAMVEWKQQTAGDPAAWERSDAMRWRREAEAALSK
jgi:tetratricopeptide (TPR) repeat protein